MESEAIAILNSVDAGGRLAFNLASLPYLKRESFNSDLEYHRECILTHLYPLRGFVSQRFERSKIGFKEASVVASEDKLSFQLGPILRVPYGRAGLIEFRDFLLSMQEFYRRHAADSPCVRIINGKDRGRVTYGEIRALFWPNGGGEPLRATQYEAALRRRIDQSATLTSWLKQFALDLNKSGPHSWLSINSQVLFDYADDPVLAAVRLKMQSKEV